MSFFRGADFDGLDQELSDIADARRVKHKERQIQIAASSADTDVKQSSILEVKKLKLIDSNLCTVWSCLSFARFSRSCYGKFP